MEVDFGKVLKPMMMAGFRRFLKDDAVPTDLRRVLSALERADADTLEWEYQTGAQLQFVLDELADVEEGVLATIVDQNGHLRKLIFV